MRPILLAAAVLTGSLSASAGTRIAVLYFDNNTPDKDFDLLKKGMADMLITDLSGFEGLQVVEREKLESLLGEMKLQRSKYFNKKTALKLGKGMGATHAVTGAFSSVGKRLRIDVRLIEVASGKVVATDKVLGMKSKFFELQQELATSFACALSPAHCKETRPTSQPQAPLPAILQYAQGLDLADDGNLEEASKAMRTAMNDAPNFSAARARYREIMKRLFAAKKVRQTKLSGNQKRLRAKVDQVLSQNQLSVGYRILRGQLVLKQIDDLFDHLAAEKRPPSPEDLKRFGQLVKAYQDNQQDLLRRLDHYQKQHPGRSLPEPEIDEADGKAGRELGLGDEPGNLDFYSTIQIRRDLGSFLTTGKVPFWGTFRWSDNLARFHQVRVHSGVVIGGQPQYRSASRPPIKKLHPRFLKDGLALFEAAHRDIKTKLKDPEEIQTETIRTLDAAGQAFLELGKIEDAVAQWQLVLERYPKFEDYADFETKIADALGESL